MEELPGSVLAMQLRIDAEFGLKWSTSFESQNGGILFWARRKVIIAEDGKEDAYCEVIDSGSLKTKGETYLLQKEELMRRRLV